RRLTKYQIFKRSHCTSFYCSKRVPPQHYIYSLPSTPASSSKFPGKKNRFRNQTEPSPAPSFHSSFIFRSSPRDSIPPPLPPPKMEARWRSSAKPVQAPKTTKTVSFEEVSGKASSSEALPLSLHLTNAVFFSLFFSVVYFLLSRWREKIRTSTPLHLVNLSEIVAIFAFIASFVYLLGFFGIDFVHSLILRPSTDLWNSEDEEENEALLRKEDARKIPCGQALDCSVTSAPIISAQKVVDEKPVKLTTEEDEEIIKAIVAGTTPSYSLESKLGDCKRAASIRREALGRITGKSLSGLPLDGFDYESILGQCCEMPIGYVQIPVGIAGPLLLNGKEY
ncbi:hypothetical protein Gorai_004771, partial [Gossypium raimondii]|nr:hypothetical protein [Gossypium raimondii]